MGNVPANGLAAQYARSLRGYLTRGGEAFLHRAYDIGRKAQAGGWGVVQLARLHQQELAEYLRSAVPGREPGAAAISASEFFLEALAPFEAGQRAARETISECLRLNEALTRQKRGMEGQMTEFERSEAMWRRYETIVNTSKDSMSLIDAQFRYEAANDAYCLAMKKRRDEIIGRRVWEIWGRGVFNKMIKPNLERCMAGEELVSRAWFGFGSPERRLHEVSYCPLRHSGRVTHAIVVTRDVTERQRFEEALVQSEEHYKELFNQACVMQENLRQLSNRILHAHEEERKRISRELHDEVGQALTAVSVNLAVLRKSAGAGDQGMQERIEDSQGILAECMDRIHLFMRELRPPMLEELGLLPALNSYLNAFTERTGLRTKLRSTPEVESLGEQQKLALYRLAQESLTNAAKHAQAGMIEVSIRKTDGKIVTEVTDDGRGFDPNGVAAGTGSKRLGLLGMRERARLIGAEFVIESAPGRGTRVRVVVPVPVPVSAGQVKTPGKQYKKT